MTTPAWDQERLVPAFGLAFGLHVAVFMLLPHLNHAPIQPPLRVEIDLTQAPPQTEAAPSQPTPPQPTPPQPKPQPVPPKAIPQPHQQALPLLTARADIPPTPQDPVVPDIPATQTAAPVTPSEPVAPVSDNSATESSATASANTQTSHGEEADSAEAWDGYGQQLYEMVSRNKTYPQMAIRRHLQGRVKVSARFSMGKLVELVLLESGSGHQVLDNAAMEMLRKSVSALPVKGNLAKKTFTVIVPVDFKIEG